MTTVDKFYGIQITWETPNETGEYSFGTMYPLYDDNNVKSFPQSRRDALKLAAKKYGAKSLVSWTAYRLFERVTTNEGTQYELNGETVTRTVATTVEGYFATVRRTPEDYNEFVTIPSEKYRRERRESGEEALDEARADEYAENIQRKIRGEALVHTAEIAWLEFKGYEVGENLREKPHKKSLLASLLSR